MGRLSLVLLGAALFALPAVAQEADAGLPVDPPTADADAGPVDAGTKAPAAAAIAEGVGRHFAYGWDALGPEAGTSDVQVWVGPRWGRPEGFTAIDLRAGVVQGVGSRFAVGFFIDASPAATGVTFEPSLDARFTALVHRSFPIVDGVNWAVQAAAHFGLERAGATLLLVLDAQLQAVRLALNLEGETDADFKTGTFARSRFRQTAGLSYTLTNGFGIGLELQNRLSWATRTYVGDAFHIGPAVSYRAQRFWVAITLLSQVAAVKTAANLGGDPLELTDNERFAFRVSLGVSAF